jgi:hypothetical protein
MHSCPSLTGTKQHRLGNVDEEEREDDEEEEEEERIA